MRIASVGPRPLIVFLAVLGAACSDARTSGPDAPTSRAGTSEMRAALFDTIIARTERREAFSPVKNGRLGFDPMEAMRALRDRVVRADSDVELYYAIAELSHARRDRHLDLYLVPGGLQLPDSAGLDVLGADTRTPAQAPVRVFPDYSQDAAAYFVGDLARDDRWPDLPEIGDRVVAVNGMPIAEWEREATAYMRHSTVTGLRWKLAEAMTQATASFPPRFRGRGLELTVVGADGSQTVHELPVQPPETLDWAGVGSPGYTGFSTEMSTPTFDLLVPEDGRRFVVLIWRGFRETMVPDVDALIDFAGTRGLLDHALIMDVTRSRGGSLGPYAMQRLQPKAFKTTFGNLRISDVIGPFVEGKRQSHAARDLNDGGVPEIIDDGTWLMDWLEIDVMGALRRGDEYTNDVPFKSAHAPRDSDGILPPAPAHFRGRFGIISGPSGGSHLDQFVSITVDNELGPVVGMPPGGYSNTWEWEEELRFEETGQPVVAFMWNIGHSITPNGEVLEGNPSRIDEWIPLTPENVTGYYALMLERMLARLEID